MTASCIYEGTVRHRRVEPEREFQHRLAFVYIDLDELPTLLDGRLVRSGPGAMRFRRRDYHGDPQRPLADAVRGTVERATGHRPDGPIRVLTHPRSFGHCFNPVSFYYCFEDADAACDGSPPQAVLAEVTNTPWGERHPYVLSDAQRDRRILAGRFGKQLHVSPFMGMDHVYDVRASTPADTLSVHIESERGGSRAFDATLSLKRRELTVDSTRRMLATYPLATLRVLALIYAHAIRLRAAGVAVHPHPKVRDR